MGTQGELGYWCLQRRNGLVFQARMFRGLQTGKTLFTNISHSILPDYRFYLTLAMTDLSSLDIYDLVMKSWACSPNESVLLPFCKLAKRPSLFVTQPLTLHSCLSFSHDLSLDHQYCLVIINKLLTLSCPTYLDTWIFILTNFSSDWDVSPVFHWW